MQAHRTVIGRRKSTWGAWPASTLAAIAIALAATFRHYSVTASLLCLLAVSVVAQALGVRVGLLVMTGCALLLNELIFPLNPYLVASISTSAFVLVSSTFCLLQGRLPAAQRGESRALALVRLSQQLSQTSLEAEAWDVLGRHLQAEFGDHVIVTEGERPSGFSHWYRFPEGNAQVGLRKAPEEEQLLEAFVLHSVQAIGRLRLAQQVRQAEITQAREKLYQALLDSISHDLRIPLVSITGALSALREENFSNQPEVRRDLLENALLEADQLRRLVDNLLQMTRLEAGALRVAKKPYDLWEVVTVLLDALGPQLVGRAVELEIPDELPLVPQDPILIGQVLRNLLDNALKYSPAGSEIRIEIRAFDDRIEVSVLDRGRGVSAGEEKQLFEKFVRGQEPRVHGSGLGLSICAGLIAAHGGEIDLCARPGGGVKVTFSLPF